MSTATVLNQMRSKSMTGFYTVTPFEIPNKTNTAADLWKSNHMYKTHYDKQSEKNVKFSKIK